MKKWILPFLLTLACLHIFSQENLKLSLETGIGAAWEPNIGMPGVHVYNTLNYALNSHFLLSANMGYFQSLFESHYPQNGSFLTFDVNINAKILKFSKGDLIFGLGVSYIKGASSYEWGSSIDIKQSVDYINTIGANALLKYKHRLSERWSGNIAVRTYFPDPTVFMATFSSITYGFSYSF